MHTSPELCPFCGEPELVDLFEIYDGRDFQLETCCEAMHEAICMDMADDPQYGRELLRSLGAEAFCGHELRRVADVDTHLVLDWQLEVKPVTLHEARAFVADHHAHNRAPVSWRFGAGIWNGPDLLGVVMVGRPVARMIDAQTTVEVNRLCIRRDLGRELAWNACSMLYGWAAREAKRRGFARIITYTLESEAGTTLKAAGWTAEALTRGGSWNRPGRPRIDQAPTCRKVRWCRELNPQPQPMRMAA
jgi:hypothetical protein